MKIQTKNIQIIDGDDFDKLVKETYGKTYCFQQQDGCKDRGSEEITVPFENPYDYPNDSIKEEVNGEEMGVSFKGWLNRDTNKKLKDEKSSSSWYLELFWERNFYPHVSMIVNDLYEKGLLDKGTYSINIDW